MFQELLTQCQKVGLLWEDIFGEFVTEIMFDVHRRAKIDQRTCQVCHTRQDTLACCDYVSTFML